MIEGTDMQFQPNYAVPPGEILEEYLENAGMSQVDLARRTGLTPKAINEIVKGKASLSHDTALRLERVLGRPAHFWTNLESQYRERRARERAARDRQSQLKWLSRVPVKEMAELGWIDRYRDRGQQLEEVLRFFGVNSADEWKDVWEHSQVAYRQSQRFKASAEALSAWLRQGEIQARARRCRPFDEAGFRSLLLELRPLTREPAEVFQQELQERCAAAGVAVEFVPSLPKSRISGATRWLTPETALIQLSLRYRSDDQLWFSFFHEAGHILLHGKREVFLEGANGLDPKKEAEADDFAANLLIPRQEWDHLRAGGIPALAEVESFADRIGIAPGIVVGRLQHERIFPFNRGNKLKRRFYWAHESS